MSAVNLSVAQNTSFFSQEDKKVIKRWHKILSEEKAKRDAMPDVIQFACEKKVDFIEQKLRTDYINIGHQEKVLQHLKNSWFNGFFKKKEIEALEFSLKLANDQVAVYLKQKEHYTDILEARKKYQPNPANEHENKPSTKELNTLFLNSKGLFTKGCVEELSLKQLLNNRYLISSCLDPRDYRHFAEQKQWHVDGVEKQLDEDNKKLINLKHKCFCSQQLPETKNKQIKIADLNQEINSLEYNVSLGQTNLNNTFKEFEEKQDWADKCKGLLAQIDLYIEYRVSAEYQQSCKHSPEGIQETEKNIHEKTEAELIRNTEEEKAIIQQVT